MHQSLPLLEENVQCSLLPYWRVLQKCTNSVAPASIPLCVDENNCILSVYVYVAFSNLLFFLGNDILSLLFQISSRWGIFNVHKMHIGCPSLLPLSRSLYIWFLISFLTLWKSTESMLWHKQSACTRGLPSALLHPLLLHPVLYSTQCSTPPDALLHLVLYLPWSSTPPSALLHPVLYLTWCSTPPGPLLHQALYSTQVLYLPWS